MSEKDFDKFSKPGTMPIPSVRCDKHGFCRANVIYECKVCADEKEESAKTANNTAKAKTCADFIAHDRCIWEENLFCEKSPCKSVPRSNGHLVDGIFGAES